MKHLPKALRNWLYRYIVPRLGFIYAFSMLEYPFTGRRERWGYAGQTRQELIARYDQHMGGGYRGKKGKAQPWSDLYPEIRIVFKVYLPDFWLDQLEKLVIKWNKPIYNYMHNKENHARIPLYVAQQHRKERDLRRRWDHGRL